MSLHEKELNEINRTIKYAKINQKDLVIAYRAKTDRFDVALVDTKVKGKAAVHYEAKDVNPKDVAFVLQQAVKSLQEVK